jgi:hypothetical protein
MYREFLRSRRPRLPSAYLPKEYFFDEATGGSLPMITEELYQVIEMKVQATVNLIFVDSYDYVCFISSDSTKALWLSSSF